MRHLLRGGLLAVALAAPASAHVTVEPATSRPGELQRYEIVVPNEDTDRATTGVDIQLPRGVRLALAQAEPGWRAEVVRAGDEPRIVRYRGGSIPPDGFLTFHLMLRNPLRAGTVTFKSLQRYEGGKVVRWIGDPSSDEPAPRVRLAEPAERPASVRPAAAAADDDGGGRDGPTLAIAIAALVVGLAALVRRTR